MTEYPLTAAPILVVDDEDDIVAAPGEILRQAKYEVVIKGWWVSLERWPAQKC